MKYFIYCTKNDNLYRFRTTNKDKYIYHTDKVGERLNGKVVAMFETDKVVEIIYGSNMISFEKNSCVERVSMFKYLNPNVIFDNKLERLLQASEGRKIGYAIHIENLKIFDKPKELSEFKKRNELEFWQWNAGCELYSPLTKAPQNMCYCEYNGEKCVVISIQPQWVCKILNGEKTIEVRKRVLKEMMK